VAKLHVGAPAKTKLGEFMQHFPAGKVIVREGEIGAEMFIIQQGQVRISRKAGGSDRELAILEKGDFFGEMALLEELPQRSATATAVTDVEALQLTASDLDGLLRRKPDIAIRMMMKLSERLREANRRYEELLGKKAELAAMAPAPASQGVEAWAMLAHDASGRLFPLRPVGDTTVGRHDPVTGVTPDIDLSSLDPERTVSRRHATLRAAGSDLSITEINASTNGTFVNGVRLEPFQPCPLESGSMVQLALVPLRLVVVVTPG
jgi:CRP-like cAMP-binding protein